MSIGCRISSSWPPGSPMTRARPTCFGSRARIAERCSNMVFPLYDDNPLKLTVNPIVTWLLILANLLVFLVEIGGSDAEAQAIANAFGVTPAALVGSTPA